MSVFRRRRVFRNFGDTPPIFGAAVVTASVLTGAVAFGGVATGSTTGTGADASGSMVFGGGGPAEIVLQNGAAGPVAFGGTAAGVQRSFAFAPSGTVTFGGIARPTITAAGQVRIGGTATAATNFTSEVSAAIVFGGTVDGAFTATASGGVVFAGTLGAPDISGAGVIESAAAAAVVLGGTAGGALTDAATGVVRFGGFAAGTPDILEQVAQSPSRCFIDFNPDRCQISMATRINERSQLAVTYKFDVLPSTVRYRLDCETTLTENLIPWTVLTPSLSGTLTIPSSANRIVDSTNRLEEKTLMIETNYDTEAASNFTRSYTVKNRIGKE